MLIFSPDVALRPQVLEGDATSNTSLGITVPNGANNAVLLPSTPLLTFVASPEILQLSSSPSLAANLALEDVAGGGGSSKLGGDGGMITVDTTPPEVDEGMGVVVSGDGNGTYTNNDAVFVTVW